MKSKLSFYSFLAILVVSICGSGCRVHDNNDKKTNEGNLKVADMEFTEIEYDFGRVPEGKKVRHSFGFYNKGNGDLSIASAVASCGCTITKYDKKPIPPGEKGAIEVSFDTKGRSGRQTKTITIKSNALKPVNMIKIRAEIVSSNNN